MTDKDFYYLSSGENREICNVVIRQPRVRELLKYEIDVDELVQPFFAFIDLWDVDDEIKSKHKNLDLIFSDHIICQKEGVINNSMLTAMITALRLLCGSNEIEYDMFNRYIKINGIEKINRDNFDEIQSYILSIFYAKKPKQQKIKGDKKQKDKVLEMQRKLALHRKKKKLLLPDIVKVVKNGRGLLGYENILDMTYWQLMDNYSDILKVDAYKTYMDYKLSSKYELKEDKFKHWTEEIKIEVD